MRSSRPFALTLLMLCSGIVLVSACVADGAEPVLVSQLNCAGAVEWVSRPDTSGSDSGAEDFGLSATGRFVAFHGATGLYLYDRTTHTRRLVHEPGGAEPTVSRDGTVVAFQGSAGLGSSSGAVEAEAWQDPAQIYVMDLTHDALELVSVSMTGEAANGECGAPSMSADGRRIAFTSTADNLASGDHNRQADVFVRDRARGTTTLVSAGDGWPEGGGADRPAISPDGSVVVYVGGARHPPMLYIYDFDNGNTMRARLGPNGAPVPVTGPFSHRPWYGQYVAFPSSLQAFPEAARQGKSNVCLYDVSAGVGHFLLAVELDGRSVHPVVASAPTVTRDGRYVVADALIDDVTAIQIVVIDTQERQVACVSRGADGIFGDAHSTAPQISQDGRWIAFLSCAGNLCPATGTPPTGRPSRGPQELYVVANPLLSAGGSSGAATADVL